VRERERERESVKPGITDPTRNSEKENTQIPKKSILTSHQDVFSGQDLQVQQDLRYLSTVTGLVYNYIRNYSIPYTHLSLPLPFFLANSGSGSLGERSKYAWNVRRHSI